MSTEFQQPNNGEIIDALHINQFVPPVRDLEIGAAHFRPATTSGSDYVVDFQKSTNPDGHFLASLSQGQIIVFKADADSIAGAELQVALEGGGSAVHPIYQSSSPIEAGDIKADQIVMVIFNNTSTPRFDVVGATSAAGGGGGGANSLDELTDVAISSPQNQDILQYDNGNFVNRDPASAGIAAAVHTHVIADVSGLESALDAKQDTLTGISDVPGLDTALAGKAETDHTHDASAIVSGTISVAQGGTGASTAADARTNLDVPSHADLTTGLAAKQELAEKGVADGYAGLDAGGKVPLSQLPSLSGELDDLSDVTITTPAAGQTLRYNGSEFVNAVLTPADVSAQPQDPTLDDISGLVMAKGDIFVHDGTGVSKLSPGIDDQVLSVDATTATGLKWTSSAGGGGATSLDELTDVAISGVPADGEILQSDGTNFVNRTLSSAGIAETDHEHSVDDITSGVFPVARGGTGLGSYGGAGRMLYSSSSSAFAALNPGSAGQVLTMASSGVPNWETPSSSGVTGSGYAGGLAIWSDPDCLTSSSNYYLSGSILHAYWPSSTSGVYDTSSGDLWLYRCGYPKAKFANYYTFLFTVPAYSYAGASLYRFTNTGEVHHWSSSKKTKRNIRPMESVGSKVRQLRPVRFEGTAPPDEGSEEIQYKESFGLIAEEVAEVFPDLCYTIPGEKEGDPSGIHYDRLPIYLLAAWKEQSEAFEARLAKLEGAK